MFTIPRPNVIESDAGFSVEVLGRVGIRYREGDKSFFVDSEVLARNGIAIFQNNIREWDSPRGHGSVSAGKRAEIVRNITAAMEFRGEPVQICG